MCDVEERIDNYIDSVVSNIPKYIKSPAELSYFTARLRCEFATFHSVVSAEEDKSKFEIYKEFLLENLELYVKFMEDIENEEGFFNTYFQEAIQHYVTSEGS